MESPVRASPSSSVRAAVVGATGYTGAEMLRLLYEHPGVRLGSVCGHSKAGLRVAEVLPHFAGILDQKIESTDAQRLAREHDAIFCCLPHGAGAQLVADLHAAGRTVFDLSADFRLRDTSVYRHWYGDHPASALVPQATYGLVELYRERLRSAQLVAVPGCYPTAAIVGLAPLLDAGLIKPLDIIIDAKSGASGAGRTLREGSLFAEVDSGIRSYKLAGTHRHTPEIEQALSDIAQERVAVTFSPHLTPMTRGILSTSYALWSKEITADLCTEAARSFYADAPLITVLDPEKHPDTNSVRGTSRSMVSYHVDKRVGRVVTVASIDNLLKGAASQALQAFNVRFGFPEEYGLTSLGPWP
ncbi:MAG: N-acetyl-gamma-glutamyl-phosphate reductase [Myxococcota bacterium]